MTRAISNVGKRIRASEKVTKLNNEIRTVGEGVISRVFLVTSHKSPSNY